MTMLKSLVSAGGLYHVNIETVPAFFGLQEDQEEVFQRLSDEQKCHFLVNRYRFDFPRINVIVLARMLSHVLKRRYDNFAKFFTANSSEQDQPLICPESDIVILCLEEYVMNPLILGLSEMNKHFDEKTTNPALYAHQDFEIEKCKDKDEYLEHMKTQQLEALYVMVEVLQSKEYQFYKTNYSFMGNFQKSPTFIRNHSINYLMEIRDPLLNYLKHAFQICPQVVSADLSEVPYTKLRVKRNRLADFAQLWLRILQPWNQTSAFLHAATNIRLPPDREFSSTIELFNSGELSREAFEATMKKRMDLFDIYNEVNDEAFNILFHSSISSGTHSISFESESWEEDLMQEEAPEGSKEQQAREQWLPYVKEMSPFYLDLLQEYFHALNFSGNFTFEDIMIVHELS